MLRGVLKMWALGPWVPLVLALPTALLWFFAWTYRPQEARPAARRSTATWLLFGLGAVCWPLLCAALATFGPAPTAVYLLGREGERRIAALSETSSRGGTSCRVFTWSLPDGGWIGGGAASGSCEPSAHAAWIKQPKLRPIDLWSGAMGPTVREELTRAGPLPGTGELRLVGFNAGAAHVLLQDGSTRVVPGPPTEGVVRLQLPREALPLHLAGVFDARVVDSSCGCTREPCGRLIVHRSVSFGEGPRSLSLLVEDDGDPRLMWSRTTAELFEADGPVYGALADGDDCAVVGGRSGGRVALARVHRQTGAVAERWVR